MTAPDPETPEPYATAAELAAYWRPLTDAEIARATVLLRAARDLIDEQAGSADFVQTALKWVSLDMVKRAMIGGGGVTGGSQSMADITATVQYANPMGSLYIRDRELSRLIGPHPPTGSIKMASNARVPRHIWNRQNSHQCGDSDGDS